jgi:histidinol-phosphatase (PHP family)
MSCPDYHTHTSRCGHADGNAKAYVLAARTKGLAAVGISDHLPLLPEADTSIAMDLSDLDDYVQEIQELKARFPGYVLLGIEADYRPGTIARVAELLGNYPFDYVLGSVHYLGEWGFDQSQYASGFDARDIDEIYREYFELVGDSAETKLFTMVAHVDLVKKFGHRPHSSLQVDHDRLARRLAAAGVVVELNTAGLHKPVEEIYPSLPLLRSLRAHEVGITFGSDAHEPAHVGRDFAAATELARSAGYGHYAWLEAYSSGTMPDAQRAAVRYRPLPAAR